MSAPTAIVPAEEQAKFEQAAQEFVAVLQNGDTAGAERRMTPAFRARRPSPTQESAGKGPYRPLLAARNIEFDPAQSLSHGSRVVLHARFTDHARQYRTNFIFLKSGAQWQLDGLALPATHHAASAMKGQASAH